MRGGFSLLEMAIVLALVAILVAVGAPATAAWRDGAAVRGASQSAVMMAAVARQAAIARGQRSRLRIDARAGQLLVLVGADTVLRRRLGDVHGVSLVTNRSELTYLPNGLGYGASNLRLIISRRRTADTVVVSRLGRVRH